MTTHGTVVRWLLVTMRADSMKSERFNSWEAATDAFYETVKTKPISARVYAVQAKTNRYVKTWDYERSKRNGPGRIRIDAAFALKIPQAKQDKL